LGLCSLPECSRTRHYLAHWLRDPSPSFRAQVALSRDREVFTPRSLENISSRPSSLRVTFPYRVSLGVPSRLDDDRDCSPGVSSPSAPDDIRSPLIPGLPHPVRCASRLSQPPSALLLRTPPSLLQPVTPMGFTLQSFSPATSPDTLSGPPAILPLARQRSPAPWPLADCRSATHRRNIKPAAGALLSWALPSPGDSPFLRQAPIGQCAFPLELAASRLAVSARGARRVSCGGRSA